MYKTTQKEREYQKMYYQANRDKFVEYARRYRKENKEKVGEYQKQFRDRSNYHKKYYQENKEKMKAQQRGYYQRNKEKIKERGWKKFLRENKFQLRIRTVRDEIEEVMEFGEIVEEKALERLREFIEQ